jgi:aspartate/tyrosine/aromatic aminotransferase
MFEQVQPAPPDPILGLTDAWKADPNPAKVNLGVGIYQNAAGQSPVLDSVKAAEAALLAAERTKNYLPISGDPEFGRLVERLLFRGSEAEVNDRACTAHTPGGTGALRVGADFLRDAGAGPVAWLSAPTWANHRGVFAAAGFTLRDYPYYDPAARNVDAPAWLDALRRIPRGEVVVLHAACHNPSGADPDAALWTAVAEIAAKAGWIPFLDNAYLGFGRGLDEDRIAFGAFLRAGVEFLAATSFSKNMGLYRERVGALTVVCPSTQARDAVASRVKKVVRVLYSNPPSHGGEVARRILSDPVLEVFWLRELDAMRERILGMREAFVRGMTARSVPADFSFVARQSGMFSLLGLSADQVAWLKARKSLYMTSDGRINVAGLTATNLDVVCDALADCLRSA